MTDVLLVIAMVASFVTLAGFVSICARIIGPDPEGVALSDGTDPIADGTADDTVDDGAAPEGVEVPA